MEPNPITRAIIDSTVDRGLREIDEDPRRTIRKLTDMWRMFNRGRFLDEVFELVQDLLRNEESPYYPAIESVLRHSDRLSLRTLGANIGYNSFTIGGRTIRDLEASREYRIPWAVVLRINPAQRESLSVSEIESCIRQGVMLGIYTYIIRAEGSLSCMNRLIEVFRSYPACAFFCLLPDLPLHPEHLAGFRECLNCCLMVRTGSAVTDSLIRELRRQKSLVGIYDLYDDAGAAEWLSGRRMREISRYGCSFAAAVPVDACSPEKAAEAAAACRAFRLQPQYPIFVFDLVGDLLKINRVISDEEAYFELLENGDIRTSDGILTDFRHTTNLEKLFSTALSRKPGMA